MINYKKHEVRFQKHDDGGDYFFSGGRPIFPIIGGVQTKFSTSIQTNLIYLGCVERKVWIHNIFGYFGSFIVIFCILSLIWRRGTECIQIDGLNSQGNFNKALFVCGVVNIIE